MGHGIGTAMHEPPDIPNYRTARGRRTRLSPGLVLAIEPIITAGDVETAVLDDDWTVVTVDGSRAAHVEHTIALTDDGPEILTLPAALVGARCRRRPAGPRCRRRSRGWPGAR